MSERPKADDLHGIDEVLADPAASYLLKRALQSSLSRDPVDAARDSDVLGRLLGRRCDEFFSALLAYVSQWRCLDRAVQEIHKSVVL